MLVPFVRAHVWWAVLPPNRPPGRAGKREREREEVLRGAEAVILLHDSLYNFQREFLVDVKVNNNISVRLPRLRHHGVARLGPGEGDCCELLTRRHKYP